MNDFINQFFLDNRVQDYLIVAGVILFVWLVKKYLSRYLAGLFFRLISNIWKNINKKTFSDLLVQPLGTFLLIVTAIITLDKLNFPSVLNYELYRFTLKQILHTIGTIILIFSFIRLLLRTIDFLALMLEQKANLTEDQTDNQLVVFFKDFFKVIIAINGILMLLHFAFGFRIGNLFTGLGLVGAAIALALRESLENLIASFIIFFDKPFTTGDVVKVHDITGTVEKIGLRSTRIRTEQKTFVTVPNKQMVDSIMDNLSKRTQRKGEIKLAMGLSTSAAQIENFIEEIKIILASHNPADYHVLLNSIEPGSYNLQADYFTPPISMDEFNTMKQTINLNIIHLLEEKKIELAGVGNDLRQVAVK
jgi:MscS family membrane protein